jgi:hypothetical protein
MSTETMEYLRRGLSNVGSYQISAVPWLSGNIQVPATGETPVEINFYNVTSFVSITNQGPDTIRFGFSSDGVSNNYFGRIESGSYFSADYRVSKVYLVSETANPCTADIAAGLTSVGSVVLQHNWSGSVGI